MILYHLYYNSFWALELRLSSYCRVCSFYTALIGAKFCRHNFRYAIIILVIFGAIIMPDGSGITIPGLLECL